MHRLYCLLIILFYISIAHAETLTVPVPYITIQSAIDNSIDGGTIIVSPGTYSENIDFEGNSITSQYDLDNDGIVDFNDIEIFAENWLRTSAQLVTRLKLDDNASNPFLIDEIHGVTSLNPALNSNTQDHHTTGVIDGAINFNNTYPAVTTYADLRDTYKDFFSADYSISYLCKASDFRGSIISVYNLGNGRSVDIATLFHEQGYVSAGQFFSFEQRADVPSKYANQWTLFTHTIQQVGPDVRVRLFANGLPYVDQLIENFDLSLWNQSDPDLYTSPYLCALAEWDGIAEYATAKEGFNCSLDEVRFYKGVLTDKDIYNLCRQFGITYEGSASNSGLNGDFNGDNRVDFKDLALLAENWLWKAYW